MEKEGDTWIHKGGGKEKYVVELPSISYELISRNPSPSSLISLSKGFVNSYDPYPYRKFEISKNQGMKNMLDEISRFSSFKRIFWNNLIYKKNRERDSSNSTDMRVHIKMTA